MTLHLCVGSRCCQSRAVTPEHCRTFWKYRFKKINMQFNHSSLSLSSFLVIVFPGLCMSACIRMCVRVLITLKLVSSHIIHIHLYAHVPVFKNDWTIPVSCIWHSIFSRKIILSGCGYAKVGIKPGIIIHSPVIGHLDCVQFFTIIHSSGYENSFSHIFCVHLSFIRDRGFEVELLSQQVCNILRVFDRYLT